ncbi:MAG TPA: amino acid adenylation domain-containing protein [Coleofasciculaceae cyanobacterium]|jgi:amino acid adenylation domain-containing protein
MSGIKERIAALSPEQRKLLELRLKRKQTNSEIINAIAKRKASDPVLLSLMQERLWFGHQLQPELPLYNESSLFKLIGTLDIAVIEKSINKIIQRHEVLRTCFEVIDEKVTQNIAPELIISVPVINLKQYSKPEQEARLPEIINNYCCQAFNLEQLPLLKTIIISLSEQEHLMLVTMHHIVSDGWSWSVFYRELATLYQSLAQNKALCLAELPIQYGDFALWHRKFIQNKITPQLNYWKQQLKNAPPILELPTDYSRPSQQTFQGKRETFRFSPQLTKSLKNLSKQENITLFMLLLAAFKTLLYRYSQQTDILVGTPVANRDRLETESLIGCFINTIVLRTNLDRNPSFLELLQRIKATTLAAYNHQDLPFEELVKELHPERSQAANPLFQVMFVFQDTPLLSLQLPGLTITPLPIDNGIAKFDLTLYIEDTQEELIGFLEYSSDLFHGDTIKRMIANFQTLLAGITTNPTINISQLPILTASERNKLLVEWNDTKRDYQLDVCLHQLFETQVAKTPDAVAVVFDDQNLTYSELNHKADRLANYLQQLGVGKDVLVGICLDRSLEMVIGLLGILKAGGAYLPIDPSYPWQRIDFILKDAELKIILTQQHLSQRLFSNRSQLICLDTDWENTAQENQTHPINHSTAESLAYVIYTSGSTGTPKGAMNTHRGICNRLLWMQETYQLTTADSVLQKTPFSFDVSIWEFFWTLTTGARLVIAKPGGHQDSTYLVKQIAQHNITTIHFVPSMLQIFLAAPGLESLTSLKRVICSGEALSVGLQQRFFARLDSELHNLYGPTEAAIDVTYWQCQPECRRERQLDRGNMLATVPIGRPIANTEIYILDNHLQPLPIGVPGELYIGGVGIAKGYLNRPELTKEKFIPNPFSVNSNNNYSPFPIPHSLIYKTGDKARYFPTLKDTAPRPLGWGNIEYIGRIDNQVKLRGFRIELGEIESVLSGHPGVREAVVLVKEEQKSLVAYIVLQQSKTSMKEVRCFLDRQLPEYMIPNAFVFIDALPLTVNGKVDRRSLFTLEVAPTSIENNYTAPTTPIQEILTGIWAQILNLTQVGIEDNFFELGGHSLLATQVISQVRKTLQVEIPLRELFTAPTVAQFAQLIETAINSQLQLESVPLKPVYRNTDLPLSFAQQRLWFLQQLELDSTAYNGSNALLMEGIVNLEALANSINEIVRRHEILRTSFEFVDDRPIQKIISKLKIPLTVINLQKLSETERQVEVIRLEKIAAQEPFDLTQAPLLRLTLLQLETEKHILLVTMHHIISDAWSAGIFIQEISALYQAFSTGKPSPLSELPIQYVDFAVWQQQWLQGEVLESQLAYWKRQLQGAKTILELPTDKPRREQTYIGKKYTFSLTVKLSQQLEIFSQQQGVTLFMTLLTAFNTLLYSYNHQEDILVGSPIANRNRSELEGLIGFFVNTLVLRTDLSNNPSFKELLQRVREVALGAYAHQDLPFEKLVSELKPERYRDRSPLFQVWLVLQNAPTADLKLPGLNLSLLDVESGMVRHALKLDLTKTESEITGFFEYKQDLFSESAIAVMAQRLQILIGLIIEQPELRLNELLKVVMTTERGQQKLESDRFKKKQIQQLSQFKRKTINP